MGDRAESGRSGALSDSAFWQAATVSVPLAVTAAVLVFSLIASAVDGLFPSLDLSRHWIYAAVVTLTAMAAAFLARPGTARTLGAAAGVSTAGALVVFVWLATV